MPVAAAGAGLYDVEIHVFAGDAAGALVALVRPEGVGALLADVPLADGLNDRLAVLDDGAAPAAPVLDVGGLRDAREGGHGAAPMKASSVSGFRMDEMIPGSIDSGT